MAARWKAVIEGSNAYPISQGNSSYTAVALDILGIFPSYEVESETQTSMSGKQIGRRKFRTVLEIDCIPFTTFDYDMTSTTENTLFLIQEVLSRQFCRIKPNNSPSETLPYRYHDATHFPLTTALISSGFDFVKCDISMAKQWATGTEKLTLTCYKSTL